MNFTLEQIIEEDLTTSCKFKEQYLYYSKYMDKWVEGLPKKQKYFKLFFDDSRPALNLQEMLLYNALRYVKPEYKMNYVIDLGILCKEKSYTTFISVFDSLKNKGYINVYADKKFTKIHGHIANNRNKSRVYIKCLNGFGRSVNYEWV